MKFGKVTQPELVDFTMPADHKDTKRLLTKLKNDKPIEVFVGCAKWNRADLKGFYPRGTKDELSYYSSQFNSIELNATFYRQYPPEQFAKWYNKTPENFKFFPKLVQNISHWQRLQNVDDLVNDYLYAASHLKEKLGTIFLQLHTNFAPKNVDKVIAFAESWPKDQPLAIELRHTDWFTDKVVAEEIYQVFEENNIANILVDTAGRRDIMHMRLTNNEAFIRYVGANHESDYTRLDDWVERLKKWADLGLQKIHFFVHQNMEEASPLLSAHFIKKLNTTLGTDLTIPVMGNNKPQQTLF